MLESLIGNKNITIKEDWLDNNLWIEMKDGRITTFDLYIKTLIINVLEEAVKGGK